jgi:hypothetical protein
MAEITLGNNNNTMNINNSMSTYVTTDSAGKGYINFDTDTSPRGMFFLNVYPPNVDGNSYGSYLCTYEGTTLLTLYTITQLNLVGAVSASGTQLNFDTSAAGGSLMYFGIQRLVYNPLSP